MNRSFFNQGIRRTASGLLVLGLAVCARGQNTNFDFQAVQAAADVGQARAQLEVAQCYAAGRGVERNYPKAAEYLQKAAQQGDANAEVILGAFYGQGRGVPRSIAMAVHWYQKAADQGNAVGQYAMGNFYALGRGVTNDMNQAIIWWRKAADQNLADAEHALGKLYLYPAAPYGTNYLNYGEGVGLLRLAVAQGNVPAMNDLGVAYESGLGVKLDFKEAAKLYRMGAEKGDALAQANLGQLYFDGRGVPFDLEQAYKWFKLSSLQGEPLGVQGFNNFETFKLLTPKQMADAEQMVIDYKPTVAKGQP